MNIESNLSGHWTDEQLIEHLYGVGPEQDHVADCSRCRERLAAMHTQRPIQEANAEVLNEAVLQRLSAQRRAIYARITQPTPSSLGLSLGLYVRRWTGAIAMLALLGGGAFLYEHNRVDQISRNKVTDVQLAQEVSQIADDSEPSPTAPLQELFIE